MHDLQNARSTIADQTSALVDNAVDVVHHVRPLATEAVHAGAGAVHAGRRALRGALPGHRSTRRRAAMPSIVLIVSVLVAMAAWRTTRRRARERAASDGARR